VGTGWYYSVLGGGYSRWDKFPVNNTPGTPLKLDNTATSGQQGDSAVSTVFNGNFDVSSAWRKPTDPIPGWVFENNSNLGQNRLVDWKNITSLSDTFQTGWTSIPSPTNLDGVPQLGTYLGKLGIDPNAPNYKTNYAIRLNFNDELVHSAFVTSDWGDLRLDLEVPNPTGGKLELWMKASDDPNAVWQELYTLASQQSGPPSAVPLYGVDLQKGTLINQVGLVEYRDKIEVNGVNVDVNFPDIPRHGFETFDFKVPDALRGKSSLLKFKLTGATSEAYLDNVFFKSSHLKLGNPSNARVDETTQSNYLMERSQFSLSYNNNTKIANWVAWQLNGGDLGANSRYGGNFRRDYTLPTSFGNNQPVHADYTNSNIDRGHMIASSHQTSSYKDNYETFLLTNVLPQFIDNNRGTFNSTGGGNSAWYSLEAASRIAVQNSNLELYNFAGGIDIDNNWTPQRATRAITTSPAGLDTNPTKLQTEGIYIPRFTWKIVLGLTQGQGIQDVTTSTPVVAVITPNQAEPPEFYLNPPQLVEHPLRPGVWINRNQWRDWHTWQVSVSEIEQRTGLQFFMDLPVGIRNVLKGNNNGNLPTAPLLAENENPTNSTIFDSTKISDTIQILGISQVGRYPQITDLNSVQVGTSEVGIFHDGFGHRSLSEVGSTEIGSGEVTFVHPTSSQISITKVSIGEIGSTQVGSTQISSTEVTAAQINNDKKIFISNGTSHHYSTQVNFPEVSMPRSIESPKFISSHLLHDNTPLLNSIYSTAQTLWHTTTPIDLTFKIQDLPTRQLAEGTITSYNTNGTPKTATITIDDDANSVGWFIDTTPQDNNEFTGIDNYLQATPNSPAAGKYDLLTTILHEMGHTLGIINGYSEFDKYVKGRQFITDTFTANLTTDGSHLDTTFHPYDLMNTSLKPGIRKLPSALNLAMIDAINAGIGNWESGVAGTISAPLTAGALIGITNGTATLTEQSQKLSELTQAFIIPTGAKTLQFTIKDNHLISGDTTKTANDAFEVALLDTNTFKPLAGTSIGLNHTDSLLNIQANGTIHKSDKVTITALGNNSSIVTIDLTQITPTTQATLYFNLLGFGARTSTVTIDDVKLFTDTQPIPITNNDVVITNQNTPLILDINQITNNDTNINQIQIINQPTHGTITQNPNGQITYKPVSTYVGNDSFTYLGFSPDGQISNLSTVNITVNNVAPTIDSVTIPSTSKEGQNIQLSATAQDGGSPNNLTYTWNLGDGSNPISSREITHPFTDNGN
jgi:DNA/RNA endonuclease G (NUC1)